MYDQLVIFGWSNLRTWSSATITLSGIAVCGKVQESSEGPTLSNFESVHIGDEDCLEIRTQLKLPYNLTIPPASHFSLRMRISITVVAADVVVTNDFIQLEVFPDMSLDDIKGFVEAEINVPPAAQNYIINDQMVTQTSRKLTDLGINDGDIISLAIKTNQQGPQRRAPATSAQQRPSQRQRSGPDPEMLRLQILGDQRLQAEVRNQDPELAAAMNDADRFHQLWDVRVRQREAAEREKQEMLDRLEADPFNVEAQAKIEEMIRQQRVMENMQKGMEENPESFGHVIMLYIDVLVNNIPIKAFVDSGAQTTIMSPSAAERCGIMRLIDKRFAGIARGVGTAQILGRVHSAEIQIGQYQLASSFTVMEGKDVDLLLGLDMLKRHQMCIDLKDNCLRVGEDKVQFLPENEIPKMMENLLEKEPKVQGPGGTTIGTETGTVEQASSSSTTRSAPSGPSQTTSGSRITIHPSGSAGNIETSRPSNPTPISAQHPPAIPTPSSATAPAFGAPAPITEQSIAQVMELGFSRQEALTALQQAAGNVELAIGLLL